MIAVPTKTLDFQTIDGPLEELLVSTDNLIGREIIKRIPDHPDVVMYFSASFKLARNAFGSIRFLCTGKKDSSGALPRPEFCLSVAPIARTVLDTIMTSIFLFEDLVPRWDWFLKTGWRELKIEFDQMVADFGNLDNWKPFLQKVDAMVAAGVPMLGLTPEQVSNPKRGIERWPNPGGMREVGRIASLGDKPLVVLSRDPNPQVGWGSATLRSKLGEDAGRASEPLLTGSAIRCARCNSLHPE